MEAGKPFDMFLKMALGKCMAKRWLGSGANGSLTVPEAMMGAEGPVDELREKVRFLPLLFSHPPRDELHTCTYKYTLQGPVRSDPPTNLMRDPICAESPPLLGSNRVRVHSFHSPPLLTRFARLTPLHLFHSPPLLARFAHHPSSLAS